jgi:dihydroorotase
MLLIKGGTVVDPGSKTEAALDLLVKEGKIVRQEKKIEVSAAAGGMLIDAGGCQVIPGMIDLHVHLREPGEEYKEDILSGQRAAAAGGFTAIVPMPNTNPPIDQAAAVQSILERSRRAGLIRVYPVGCATLGRQGQALSEYGEMKENGIVAVTDDGGSVADSHLLRCVLEYARNFGLPYISHTEDASLANRGSIHEGLVSLRLGLRGIPREAESLAVQKEIVLARMTGGRIHFTHISAWESVEAIRRAKKEGLAVSMDVTPHHLTFTDADMPGYDTNFKMNPPLREARDREALLRAVEDGTADAIATDHAPHALFEKEVEFAEAPFGVIGLETCLPAVGGLAQRTKIPLQRWIELLTCGPARVLGLPGGGLSVGAAADITIFRSGVDHQIDPQTFQSKGRNTPFAGMTLPWKVEYTICDGRLVFDARRGIVG